MTLALVTGTLFRAPEQRTSKAGRPFVVATIRAKDGEGSQFWRVTVFSESAGEELMRLSDGDAVSAQGRLDVSTYQRDGVTKIGFGLIADRVLALRQPRVGKAASSDDDKAGHPTSRQPRRPATSHRRVAERPSDRSRQERVRGVADPDLNDDVPF